MWGALLGGKGVDARGHGQEFLAFSRFMRVAIALPSCQRGISHLCVRTAACGGGTVTVREATGLGYGQSQRGPARGGGRKTPAVPWGGLGLAELALVQPARKRAREEIPE